MLLWPVVVLLLATFAAIRPVDHDESQYVAAAVLAAHGFLPYRDFLYLQAPLQPFLLAPLAWSAAAWPMLRIANALLGAVALVCTYRAARLLAPARAALAATLLFACCDSFLFSVGTARNDALPAACLAGALWLAVRAEKEGATRLRAFAAGLLLAAAASAKVSYAVPALAYSGWALVHRRHRAAHVALGAAPVAAFVAWTVTTAPAAVWFGVFAFPAIAPYDFYADRPFKLSCWAKLLDVAKFLALGPALPALVLAARRPRPGLATALLLAGLVAAVAPTPTWRQYLLPALPPLFLLLARRLGSAPPGRSARAVLIAFALIGLAPSALALTRAPAMPTAWRDGRAIGAALDRAGVTGPVATLSPQFLPAARRLPDRRFATGPFWFRTRTLAAPVGPPLVAARDLASAPLPRAVLVGGEGRRTGGDDRLDRLLARGAARRGYRRREIAGTGFALWTAP